MKATRKLELAATLVLITLYVGMAHVAAAEKVANALLAGGGAVSPALLVFVVALVVLRFLVVMVLPGVVAALHQPAQDTVGPHRATGWVLDTSEDALSR